MRCDECGHSLAGIPSGAPCTECGLVTPDARRTPPRVNVAVAVAEYAWPFAVVATGGMMVIWAFRHGDAGALPGLLVVVVGLALVPLAAAVTTARLMLRVPRRSRWSPLLLLVPRMVAVPLLAAAAMAFLGIAIAFAGGLVALQCLRT